MLKILFALSLVCGVMFTSQLKAADAAAEPGAKAADVTLKITGMT
jgi:hypothetical protein